jgi:putative membrane protein
MKTLILCVDRDDDLGRKGHVDTPIIGRRRILDAAIALGVADPEDSDTNALLAGVHLYDKESKINGQVEIAAIAGHHHVGLKSDRIMADQLDEIMALTHADEIILISDGAEDEQILPILQSRAKVSHMHRNIVKQSPRLEGTLYMFQRMLDDEKLARRYVLPVALVLMVWGVAFLFNKSQIATGLTLGILGGWLVVHSMKWEDRVGSFFDDFRGGLRSGKINLFANLAMVSILLIGGIQAWDKMPDSDLWHQIIAFLDVFLLYFVSGLLVSTAGNLFDEIFREGRVSLGHWTFAFTLIAFGFVGGAMLDIARSVKENVPFADAIGSLDIIVRLLVGLGVMASGVILGRYVRSFSAEPA